MDMEMEREMETASYFDAVSSVEGQQCNRTTDPAQEEEEEEEEEVTMAACSVQRACRVRCGLDVDDDEEASIVGVSNAWMDGLIDSMSGTYLGPERAEDQ
jgi:hypothetical protein